MDGVLVDFFGGLEREFNVNHWKDIKDINDALAKLKDTSFFGYLDAFDTTYPLVGHVKELTHKYPHLDWGICSTPLRNDRDNCAYWKRRWLESHNLMPPVHRLVFTHTKHKFATNRPPLVQVGKKDHWVVETPWSIATKNMKVKLEGK